MADAALADLVVLELAEGVAGPFCGRILADLGASVVKVERPDTGDPQRWRAPFRGSEAHPEKAGLFLYLNAGKRSAALDLHSAEAQRLLRRWAREADVVLDGLPPGRLERLGLGYERLARQNRRLVLTRITPFGQSGPYRDWKGAEPILYAMGGYMYFGGSPEREPLMLPGCQAQLHGGLQAALATLAAVYWAQETGQGQEVDVSSWEAMLSAHAWLTVAWSHEGKVLTRGLPDLIPCKDGLIFFMRLLHRPELFLLIGRPELADDPRWNTVQGWIINGEPLWQMVSEWCRERTKQEIYHAAQALRIPVTPVNTVEDLVRSAQLQARQWWQEVEHPVAGRALYPGVPYHLSETPARIQRPAPLLGQHSAELRQQGVACLRQAPVVPPTRRRARTRSGPLVGIKIVEVTANWAGPLAGRWLADLGADVIKIELASKPATRGIHHAGQPFKYHFNRAGYFNQMNRNKRGITLDLSKPLGRETFLRLVRWADLVIENNSARVMPNLGLGYDTLSQVNPRATMISMNAFGCTGPERDYVGHGSNIEASSGLTALTGYHDAPQRYRTGSFYADPVTGSFGAIAALAALLYRRRSGRGQFVDMALQESAINMFAEAVMEHTLTDRAPAVLGNRHREFAPQGCYPCVGDDMWLALTVRDKEEWGGLCMAIGQPALAQDPRFGTPEARRQHHDELDGIIARWTAQHDHNEAARLLQRHGVPAGPVYTNWELLADPHLFGRQFYRPVVHPEIGAFPFPSWPWQLSRTPAAIRLPAPCFAQHNREVFREVLGMTEDQIQALYSEGAASDSLTPDPGASVAAPIPSRPNYVPPHLRQPPAQR